MKKIPRDANWHYLKWLGIFVVSILLLGVVINFNTSMSVLSIFFTAAAPVLLGIFIAVILNVPVNLLERKVFKKLTQKNGRIWSKIKRAVSISISLTLFFLISTIIIFYIFPEFTKTCEHFIEQAPSYMDSFTNTLREWTVKLHLPIAPEHINFSWDTIAAWATSFIGNNSSDVFHNVLNTAITIFTSIWNVCLGFVIAVYIIASKERLVKTFKGFIYSVAKKEKAHNIFSVLRLTKKAFEDFITGQCLDVVCIGSLTFIGMLIFQFPHAAMISCIIAVTAFIPIFGAIIGAIIGALIILLISPIKALWFLIFIIVLQQIESNVIYPRIMGQQIGLPSLWVLIAVMLGGGLFGILGILICVPLCSVLYTLFNQWILKRLREKKLCRQSATEIPAEITQLSDEEFLSPEPEPKPEANKKEKKKNIQNKKK